MYFNYWFLVVSLVVLSDFWIFLVVSSLMVFFLVAGGFKRVVLSGFLWFLVVVLSGFLGFFKWLRDSPAAIFCFFTFPLPLSR